MTTNKSPKVKIIASEKNWIEGWSIEQIKQTAALSGMKLAVGMPDLHPGKGHPIGAAFISEGIFYPYLVGNDIGCGMALWQTDISQRKLKLDRLVKKLHNLDAPWEGDVATWLNNYQLESDEFNSSLGTIGGGNHFAELQQLESIEDEATFTKFGLNQENLVLLVHSGSRGKGEAILREYTNQHQAKGLIDTSEDAQQYLSKHDRALQWACANRGLIAHRFFSCLGAEGELLVDVNHNTVTPVVYDNANCWLHRKGASPSDQGIIMIPGSRGTYSYLVQPIGEQKENAYSLAHGAGRKWKRSEAKSNLSRRYQVEDLTKTQFGSRVICEDKNLIYEEAPQAYKNIDIVIQDMVDAGLIKVIAVYRPVITYKKRRRLNSELRSMKNRRFRGSKKNNR